MVLLDILARGDDHLVVAHVDHDIRSTSADDARFVKRLAQKYQLPFVSTTLSLGPEASEEQAREARYKFLFEQVAEHSAELVTAHHEDDMIGSVAINILRGTGWRGLAVLNRQNISRPLIGWSKQKIYDYALKNQLEWVEDETNAQMIYLRNRLRGRVSQLDKSSRRRLAKLRSRQIQLKKDIDLESARLGQKFASRRYPYTMIAPEIAVELLRRQLAITRPQAERLHLAIKTAKHGSRVDIGGCLKADFSRESFVVEKHP